MFQQPLMPKDESIGLLTQHMVPLLSGVVVPGEPLGTPDEFQRAKPMFADDDPPV